MIAVEGVTRTYGDFTAFIDVTFTAEPGRVTGFLGPNGAGKSTRMRIIVGLTSPTHGSAHVLGCRFADPPNPGLEVGVLLDARQPSTPVSEVPLPEDWGSLISTVSPSRRATGRSCSPATSGCTPSTLTCGSPGCPEA